VAIENWDQRLPLYLFEHLTPCFEKISMSKNHTEIIERMVILIWRRLNVL